MKREGAPAAWSRGWQGHDSCWDNLPEMEKAPGLLCAGGLNNTNKAEFSPPNRLPLSLARGAFPEKSCPYSGLGLPSVFPAPSQFPSGIQQEDLALTAAGPHGIYTRFRTTAFLFVYIQRGEGDFPQRSLAIIVASCRRGSQGKPSQSGQVVPIT